MKPTEHLVFLNGEFLQKAMRVGLVEGAQTLIKGLTLLELVAERQRDQGVSLAQLTKELGWNKATTHRLLSTLVGLGYAQQNPQNGSYRLGLKALQLGAAFSRDLDFQSAAAPVLKELAAKTEFGASLVILDGATREVVFIDRVDGSHDLRMHMEIGMRFPWNCTAAGKAIAAFSPDAEAELLLSGKLGRRTIASVHNAQTLCNHFELIKASGFATDNGENSDGVCCVAAPIFDALRRPIAAISISGYKGQMPTERFNKLGGTVRKAAASVSRQMGFRK